MKITEPFVDCCKQPVLDDVKTFLATDCESIAIRRCRNCQCHWYYHLKEYALLTDEYNRRVWCVRLIPDEAETFVKAAQSPAASLFANRAGIVRDEDGIRKVQGVPEFIRQSIMA